MMKILEQPWGGLGDNLQFSTLPEKFSEKSIEVFISDKNSYRSHEIKELVWTKNPYVKGISSQPSNIGSCIPYRRKYSDKSIVFNQEACHGLEPTNETPKIFYEPKLLKDFENCVFVDISAKSSAPLIPNNFNDYLKSNFLNKTIIIPSFKNKVDSEKRKDFNFDYEINIESIFHFCELIHSCNHFVCAFSGQSLLASALNKRNTTCFVRKAYESCDFCFPNIKYHSI